jgi:DNA-binding IclR family transcriptional regulator
MTSQEIATLTGFKPNSVRGTLWTLGNEGLAVKRGGRWYPAPSSSEVSLNPSEGGVAEAGGGLR